MPPCAGAMLILLGLAFLASGYASSAPLMMTLYGLRNVCLPLAAALILSLVVTPRNLCVGLGVSSAVIAVLGLLQVAFHITYLTP